MCRVYHGSPEWQPGAWVLGLRIGSQGLSPLQMATASGKRLGVGDSLFHDRLKQLLLVFSIKGG